MGIILAFQLAPEEGCRQFVLNKLGDFASWYFSWLHDEECLKDFNPTVFKRALAVLRQDEPDFYAATAQEAAEVDELLSEFGFYCDCCEKLEYVSSLCRAVRYQPAIEVLRDYSCERTIRLWDMMLLGRSLAVTDFPYRYISPDDIYHSAWWSKEEVDWMHEELNRVWEKLDAEARNEHEIAFGGVMYAIHLAREKGRELMFCVA